MIKKTIIVFKFLGKIWDHLGLIGNLMGLWWEHFGNVFLSISEWFCGTIRG